MQIELHKSSFEEIQPIWSEFLWPGRKSAIRAISPISLELKYEKSIKEASSSFYALRDSKGIIVGVISGYRTTDELYRSRGLYVLPKYRNQGHSQLLLHAIKEQAEKEGCKKIWALPRKLAWPVYEKFGFIKTSDWITKEMEFGPNCIAIFSLS